MSDSTSEDTLSRSLEKDNILIALENEKQRGQSFGGQGLSVTEKIAVLSINKSIKRIERVVLYGCLCELVLLERLSTFQREAVDRSYGLYIFNKRVIGVEYLDLVRDQILLISNYQIKSIREIVKELESVIGKKIYTLVHSQLVQQGVLRANKRLIGTSFELKQEGLEDSIKGEITTALNAHQEGTYMVNGPQPDLFALVCLKGCQKRGTDLDFEEQRVAKMMGDYQTWNLDVVLKSIFERIQHLMLESRNRINN